MLSGLPWEFAFVFFLLGSEPAAAGEAAAKFTEVEAGNPFSFRPNFSLAIKDPDSETPTPLIIGGEAASPGQFPSCGSMQYEWNSGVFSHTCTGSIINSNWFVTAGHCANIGPMSNYRILMGTNNLYRNADTEQLRGLQDMQVHPKYVLNDAIIDYDVSMMMFDEPLDLSDPSFVTTATLVPQEFVTTGSGVAAGWGITTPNGNTPSSTLQYVTLPVVPWNQCQQQFANGGIDLTPRFFCAGGKKGHSTCNGDSGGPFYVSLNGNSETLSGLTSWGVTCGSKWPTAFTDLGVLGDYVSCVAAFEAPLTSAENQACGANDKK